ncbi:MAG: hypothetical protein WC856_25240 [Methylococcaceae bacterium]|jgi:hypothetical protein
MEITAKKCPTNGRFYGYLIAQQENKDNCKLPGKYDETGLAR